jgi:hypothetical protein
MKRHRKRRANLRHKKEMKFNREFYQKLYTYFFLEDFFERKFMAECKMRYPSLEPNFPSGGIASASQVDEYIVPPNTIKKICNQ